MVLDLEDVKGVSEPVIRERSSLWTERYYYINAACRSALLLHRLPLSRRRLFFIFTLHRLLSGLFCLFQDVLGHLLVSSFRRAIGRADPRHFQFEVFVFAVLVGDVNDARCLLDTSFE